MDIIEALKQEESKPQLSGIQGSIAALNGGARTVASPARTGAPNATSTKRRMFAAVRARISRTAKARWAKIRAEKAKKTK